MMESALDPQSNMRVPWMREWIDSRSESKRKACVERVASVNGKKSKICSAVDNLKLSLLSDTEAVLNDTESKT
jgi:hypothetical protein